MKRIVEVATVTAVFREVELPAKCPACEASTLHGVRERTLRYETNTLDAAFDAVDSDEGELFAVTGYVCTKCYTPFI